MNETAVMSPFLCIQNLMKFHVVVNVMYMCVCMCGSLPLLVMEGACTGVRGGSKTVQADRRREES